MNEPSVTLALLIPLPALLVLAAICSDWLWMGLPWHLAIAVPNARWIECLPQVNGEMLPLVGGETRPCYGKDRHRFSPSCNAVQCSYVLVSLASERVGRCGQGHYGDDCGCLADRVLCLSPHRNVSGLDDVRRAVDGERLSDLLLLICNEPDFCWSEAGAQLHLHLIYTSLDSAASWTQLTGMSRAALGHPPPLFTYINTHTWVWIR